MKLYFISATVLLSQFLFQSISVFCANHANRRNHIVFLRVTQRKLETY